MFCGKCGSHIADGSICCPVCGNQVAATGFARATDLVDDRPVQRKESAIPVTQTYPPPAAIPVTQTYPPPAAVPVTQTYPPSVPASPDSAKTTRLSTAGFCGSCGAPLEPGYDVCLACGRRIASAAEPNVSEPVVAKPTKPPKKKKGKGVLFVLLGLALVLIAGAVALILYLVMSAKTPESLAEDYLEAVLEPDSKAVMEMLPEGVSEDVLDAAGYDDGEQDDFCSQKTEDMNEMLSMFNLVWGPGWTYEIESTEAIECNEEELEILREQYSREYDFEIQNAVVVNVGVHFKGKLLSDIQTERVYLIQIDKQWYLDYLSNPDLFHS